MLKAMLALAAVAFAQQPLPPDATPSTEPPSVQHYGDIDTICLRWTDSCRACSRSADGAPVCSNIGIACQPKKVECLERREATPK